MDPEFGQDFKIYALVEVIYRSKRQMIRLEDKLRTRLATRKSLKHQRYCRSQLQTVKSAPSLPKNTAVLLLSDEIAAIEMLLAHYRKYVEAKSTELSYLTVYPGADSRESGCCHQNTSHLRSYL